ncbi:unnamed protein product [Arctogadus glacialis]
MLHYLMEDAPGDVSYSKEAFYIQDGNALFHALMNLPPTFEGICLQSLDHMAAKKHFVFSTDSYYNDSVKAQERLRCGVSQRCIIGGPATRSRVTSNSSWQMMRPRHNSVNYYLRVTTCETDTRVDLYLLYAAQLGHKAHGKYVNNVRSIMLKKMIGEDETLTTRSKVDVSRLPPCRHNLVPHINRVNLHLQESSHTDILVSQAP